MGKKGRPQYNGNTQNSKKDEIERLKAQAVKNKKLTEEEKKLALIEKMGEEEAKLFMSQEEILKRESEVDNKEKELEKKIKDIASRLSDLDQREKLLRMEESDVKERLESIKREANEYERQMEAMQSEIDSRNTELNKKEVQLMNRERALIERENNAENEFALQNQKALEVLRERRTNLQSQIQALEMEKVNAETGLADELAQLKIKKIEQMDVESKAYYETRKKEIDSKLDQIEKTSNDRIAHVEAMLADQRNALNFAQKETNDLRINNEEKNRQLQSREENLLLEKKMLEEEKKTNQRVVDDEVNKRVDMFRAELEDSKQTVDYYKKQAKSYEEKVRKYEQLEREADGNSVEELLRLNDALQEDIIRLKAEREELPDEALFLEYKSKALKYDSLQRNLSDTRIELYDLQNEKQQWMKTTNQLEIERENCKYLEKRREALEATIIKYGDEVNRYKSLYEQPKELAARLDAIKKSILDKKPMAELVDSEIEWLEKIYNNCVDSGIKFNKRLLYSFHTALKTSDWSPLTVLAGVSGTGKSLLPEYYSRYGGLYFMSMAVQPDWDSPQALFGYFNSVDNRFNATTLLRAMVQFSNNSEEVKKDTNLSDTMFLVLLDEMNLAHVELYFSDMLSKLERRRNTNSEVCVEIDLGAGMDKYQLELNNNVLWVGTMNEDETTKSLSDKVLDRGNLISFPRPKEFISRNKIVNDTETPMLRKATWNDWLEGSVIDNPEYKKMIKTYKKGLEDVNEALGNAGRALGHRVWQSIENYIANHPLVIQAFNEENFDKQDCNKVLESAFEEALVHKVMPKLRGIEVDGNMRTQCIDRIKEVLFGNKGIANGLLGDFENAVNNTYETFLWSSAKYLEEN